MHIHLGVQVVHVSSAVLNGVLGELQAGRRDSECCRASKSSQAQTYDRAYGGRRSCTWPTGVVSYTPVQACPAAGGGEAPLVHPCYWACLHDHALTLLTRLDIHVHQAAQRLAVHCPGSPPARRTRHSRWTAALPATTPLPEGCSAGDLCFVAEFLQASTGSASRSFRDLMALITLQFARVGGRRG